MTDKIANQPSEIMIRVAECLQAGDLEGILALYHPDCQIFFPPGEPPKQGIDGAREVFADFVGMRPILEGKVISEVVNGDTALLQADWQFKNAAGDVIAEGQSTEVVKKLENGGWGYFIDCPNGPPAA